MHSILNGTIQLSRGRRVRSTYCYANPNQPSLSDEELVEVKARLIVFDASPDGAAWRKMMHLSHKTRTRADQAELDELNRHYPGMPLKHYASWYEETRFWEEKS